MEAMRGFKNGDAQGALAKIREHLGTLEVRCPIRPTPKFFIDGASRGKLVASHASIRVESGTRDVQVRAGASPCAIGGSSGGGRGARDDPLESLPVMSNADDASQYDAAA